MKKLFYILPEYHENTSTHFGYNVELLEEAAKEMRIWLFIENGEKPRVKFIQKVYLGKFRFAPLRVLERIIIFFFARLAGYKNFYSHYAYLSALIAAFICKISFGKMFFWHCEMRKEYEVKDCGLCNLPGKISRDWPFRFILKLCYKLVTCSDLMKNYYHREFGLPAKKINIMSNWVDTNKLKNNFGGNSKTLLFLHWLSPRKGSRILPEIFLGIHKKMPGAKFIVVGEGPDYKYLQEKFKKFGLDAHVEMRGAVANKDILKLFQRSAIFLNPSREEEFGRVMIEAMAAGLPIVSTRTLGAKAILTKKQFEHTFDYENPTEGIGKCVEIFSSKTLQRSLRNEGFKRVKFFDKARILEKFKNLF